MRAIIVAALVCALAPPAHAEGAAAVPVGVVEAELRPVAKTLDFVGRVEAINRVEVRARVTGYLEAVLFKEGDLVKEGAAALPHRERPVPGGGRAGAGRAGDQQGRTPLTAMQLQRAEELLPSNAGTAVARDQAVAPEGASQGRHPDQRGQPEDRARSISATPTSLAPITGKIGRTNLTKGNVVSPDSGVADDDRQPGPDVCDVPGQPARIPARARRPASRPTSRHQGASSASPTGRSTTRSAEINFVDVTVDRATDTVHRPRHHPQPERRA